MIIVYVFYLLYNGVRLILFNFNGFGLKMIYIKEGFDEIYLNYVCF